MTVPPAPELNSPELVSRSSPRCHSHVVGYTRHGVPLFSDIGLKIDRVHDLRACVPLLMRFAGMLCAVKYTVVLSRLFLHITTGLVRTLLYVHECQRNVRDNYLASCARRFTPHGLTSPALIPSAFPPHLTLYRPLTWQNATGCP